MALSANTLLILVSVLHLIALVLAFVALRGFGRYKGDESPKYDNRCYHDFDVASGLGLGAMLILLFIHILVSTSTRCLCCGHKLRPGWARVFAYFLFVLSWVAFLLTEFFLCVGSLVLREVEEEEHWCYVIRRVAFVAGSIGIFVTGVFSGLYLFCYAKARR